MRIRKAVFPVAGLGTRFLPATKASAKEMLKARRRAKGEPKTKGESESRRAKGRA